MGNEFDAYSCERYTLRILVFPVTHSHGKLNPTEREVKMNTKRSMHSKNIRNFGLAACAIMAFGVMTAGEAAAQCRLGGSSNTGYGYGHGNTAAYAGYGNSYNYGNNGYNRATTGHNNGYGLTSGYQGYSNQRPSLSLGLSYNSNLNSGYNTGYGNYGSSGYNTGAYNNRSGHSNSNSQQPVAYRHGDHIDVETGNGRQHLTPRGY
jgi:hypothetical protein